MEIIYRPFIIDINIEGEKRKMKIKKIEKLLIFMKSGMDSPLSQYGSYAVAFAAKKIHNIPMLWYSTDSKV